MTQQVLLYTRSLPTRLAVKDALELADLVPVCCTNPVELLERTKGNTWDVIILDGESSPIPPSKLLAVMGTQAALAGAVIVALGCGEQSTLQLSEVLLYDRPLGRMPLLGAMNRMLMARGKKPILRVYKVLSPEQRRALRVPMLVPVAYRSPARHTAWEEGEVLDVSVGGAGVATLPGAVPNEILDIRNLLTNEEAAFRVAWLRGQLEEIAGGMQARGETVRFWMPNCIPPSKPSQA